VLFFFTGVTVEAARGLAVAFSFVNLLLSYALLKTRGPRWVALLALTMLVTSPFLYCFSRLAILEPLLTALTLGALNMGVRLPGHRRPVWGSVAIGLLFTLMMLTKTTAVFLLPALAWAMVLPLWEQRKLANRCLAAAGGSFVVSYGLWITAVMRAGLLADYKYLFLINNYVKPKEFYWPLISLWWSFHGGLWVDHVLVPLAGLVVLGAGFAWRSEPARKLLLDPVFGASVLAVAGYILFMTYQDNPQPRYFAVVTVFCFFIVAQGAGALFGDARSEVGSQNWLGFAVIWLVTLAVGINGAWTLNYAVHPEYTFVDAAKHMTRYIDQHPNGNRLLLSVSGDDITLITHLPSINDIFVTPTPPMMDLGGKLGYYRPGWYAAWNNLDKGAIEDLHTHFSVEQVASFRAFDNPDRDVLVLFKLNPLSGGRVYDPADQDLQVRFPEDKFDLPLQ
jgi:hypothetical protein